MSDLFGLQSEMQFVVTLVCSAVAFICGMATACFYTIARERKIYYRGKADGAIDARMQMACVVDQQQRQYPQVLQHYSRTRGLEVVK